MTNEKRTMMERDAIILLDSLDADARLCVISPTEEETIRAGGNASHRHHEHVNAGEAKLLLLGAKGAPELDVDGMARYYPEARVCSLADGTISRCHIVRMTAYGCQRSYNPPAPNDRLTVWRGGLFNPRGRK